MTAFNLLDLKIIIGYVLLLQLKRSAANTFSPIDMTVNISVNFFGEVGGLRSWVDAGLECTKQNDCLGVYLDENTHAWGAFSCSENSTDTSLIQTNSDMHLVVRSAVIPGIYW